MALGTTTAALCTGAGDTVVVVVTTAVLAVVTDPGGPLCLNILLAVMVDAIGVFGVTVMEGCGSDVIGPCCGFDGWDSGSGSVVDALRSFSSSLNTAVILSMALA